MRNPSGSLLLLPTRALRRAVLTASALLLTLAATIFGLAVPAHAATELRVLQWNIAGNSFSLLQDPNEPDNEGTMQVVRRLLEVAADKQPRLISMNESCWLQAKYARQQLANNFGDAQVQFTDTTGFDPLCGADSGSIGESGPALIAVNADGVWDRRNIYFSNDDGSISQEETGRAAACMVVSFASTLGQVVQACSVHLEPQPEELARAQAQALVQEFADSPYPVVLGGDFNTTPELLQGVYAPEQGGQGEYLDVDHPANRPTDSHNTKIDYIFGDRDHFSPTLSGEVIEPGDCPTFPFFHHPCSDHRMVFGTLTFRDDVPVQPAPGEPPANEDPVPVDTPPFVTAGADISGDEGAAIALRGAADDDHGAPSVSWSYQASSGVDAGATCQISDVHQARTTMTCTDDGTYTVRLSADDGVNDPVSATATVTVENAPPVLTLDDPAPWAVYRAGTQVDLAASFTDSGANDTHTCKVTWDDGAQESYAPISGSCDRPHTFEHPGMYTIDVTVTDDDGASDNAEVMVVVYDPDAGFVTAGSTIQSPAGALSEDPAHTGKGSFQFNPKYKPHDDGPVPGGGKVSFGLADSDLDLDATGLEWLVVTPDGKAAVKGTAKVGGDSGYGFVLYGYDDPDKLRMVVWRSSDGPVPGNNLVYDSNRGTSYDLDQAEPQAITSGSVQVHH
ncbi:PKD domain-containing protein [Nonomuraea sp. NPDC049504]|uniref:PKD domain-containing protein n=1 Tax=Nonomuraea sp. NPDC049504 TaxID=3154729 RepID=UPI003434B20E